MIKEMINNIKEVIQDDKKDDHDKINVVNAYNLEITESLIQKEHDRGINIHNWDKYLSLKEKNEVQFNKIDEILYQRHYKHYQKEVFKELGLSILFKKFTINEIDMLIQDHEDPNKKEFDMRGI